MKKILGLMVVIGLIAMSTQASDNITIPNIFSSGSTISSSQMNENFDEVKNKMNNLFSSMQNISVGDDWVRIGSIQILTGEYTVTDDNNRNINLTKSFNENLVNVSMGCVLNNGAKAGSSRAFIISDTISNEDIGYLTVVRDNCYVGTTIKYQIIGKYE